MASCTGLGFVRRTGACILVFILIKTFRETHALNVDYSNCTQLANSNVLIFNCSGTSVKSPNNIANCSSVHEYPIVECSAATLNMVLKAALAQNQTLFELDPLCTGLISHPACAPGFFSVKANTLRSSMANAMSNSSSRESQLVAIFELVMEDVYTCHPGYYCLPGLLCELPCMLGSDCTCPFEEDKTGNVTSWKCKPNSSFSQYSSQLGALSSLLGCPGTVQPNPCPKGFFCSEPAIINTCTEGHFCRDGSVEEEDCPALSSCPSGSSVPTFNLLGGFIVAFIVLLMYGTYEAYLFYKKIQYEKQDINRWRAQETIKRWKHAVSHRKVNGIPIAPVRAWLDRSRQSLILRQLESSSPADGKRSKAGHGGQGIFNSALNDPYEVNFDSEPVGLTAIKEKPLRITIGFSNLGLKLPTGKVILEGVTGQLRAGRVTAVMGPSGAGKTTLLTLLAGKNSSGKIFGEITVNGTKEPLSKYRDVTAFVPQEDTMHRSLTVLENLQFSARTRLPSYFTTAERNAVVLDVMNVLGLYEIRHSVVGDEHCRGISGGQRKRLNIGLELVSDPTLLYLDEPTSGLDSTTSQDVLKALRKLSSLGVTIGVVLHQPRFEIFRMFHDVLLLAKGGRSVYLGRTRDALPYFSSLGFRLPIHANPADWYLDIIAGQVLPIGYTSYDPMTLVREWERHARSSTSLDRSSPKKKWKGLARSGSRILERTFSKYAFSSPRSPPQNILDECAHSPAFKLSIQSPSTGCFEEYNNNTTSEGGGPTGGGHLPITTTSTSSTSATNPKSKGRATVKKVQQTWAGVSAERAGATLISERTHSVSSVVPSPPFLSNTTSARCSTDSHMEMETMVSADHSSHSLSIRDPLAIPPVVLQKRLPLAGDRDPLGTSRSNLMNALSSSIRDSFRRRRMLEASEEEAEAILAPDASIHNDDEIKCDVISPAKNSTSVSISPKRSVRRFALTGIAALNEDEEDISVRHSPGRQKEYRLWRRTKPSTLYVTCIVFGRAVSQARHEVSTYAVDTFLILIAGILIGFINRGGGLTEIPNSAFLVTLGNTLLAMQQALRLFGNEQTVYWREASWGVDRFAYFLGKNLANLIWLGIAPALFLSTFHTLSMARGNFFNWYLVLLFLWASCTAIGQAISIFVDRNKSQLTAVLLSLVFSLLCGLFPTLTALRSGMGDAALIGPVLSPSHWCFEALMFVQSDSFTPVYDIPKAVLYRTLGTVLTGWNMALVPQAGIALFFWFVTFCLLKYSHRDKQR
mmetsp:Transcript_36121/g.58386  ORF Transcript_36121/g.58386 Transcript_36121/m.58386 type:complete len:1258 (+) Transcript_36121:130-3903(+)